METFKPLNLPEAVRTLYPFESKWADINGFKYHYVDEGSGEPVVMIHGNPTWSFYFRELIKGLSRQYRTIAPDHIGCGLSDKPGTHEYDFRLNSRINDLDLFLQSLDLKQQLTLILHDWGGMIGMAYAVKHPDKIGRIVVLNTAAFLPPHDKPIPLRLKLIRSIRAFAGPAVLGLNLFARAAVYMAAAKKLPRPVKLGLLAPYNSWHNRLATLKFVQDIPLNPNDPSYATVKEAEQNLHLLSHIPMLILWGERDFVFDMDYLKEWRDRFPSADVHTFNDAGHYIVEDVPEKVLGHITLFLDQQAINSNL